MYLEAIEDFKVHSNDGDYIMFIIRYTYKVPKGSVSNKEDIELRDELLNMVVIAGDTSARVVKLSEFRSMRNSAFGKLEFINTVDVKKHMKGNGITRDTKYNNFKEL